MENIFGIDLFCLEAYRRPILINFLTSNSIEDVIKESFHWLCMAPFFLIGRLKTHNQVLGRFTSFYNPDQNHQKLLGSNISAVTDTILTKL